MIKRLLLCLVAGAMAACAGARAVGDVHARQGDWREVSSRHFTLTTDLDDVAARETLINVERLYRVLQTAPLAIQPAPDVHVRLVVFREFDDLKAFTHESISGFAMREWSGELFTAWVAEGHRGGDPRTLLHELEHTIQRLVIPRAPHWVLEGLAVYAETMSYLEDDDDRVQIGAPYYTALQRLRNQPEYDLAAMRSDRWDASEPELFLDQYSLAWLLTDYLMRTRPKEFYAWLRELGPGLGKAKDFGAAFPDLPDPVLQKALQDHAALRTYNKIVVDVPPWTGELKERELTPAQTQALFVRLAEGPHATPPFPLSDRTRPMAQEALALDPKDPEVLGAALSLVPAAQRAARLDECTAALPADWRCPTMRALIETDAHERLKRWERAARLGPNVPLPLSGLALALLEADQTDRASTVALTGLRSDPGDPALLLVLGSVRVAQGRCAEAAALFDALGTSHGGADAKEELNAILRKCIEGKPQNLGGLKADGP